jgi:hypothetical protein
MTQPRAFEIGDRVRITGHYEWPEGTTGTVSLPEPAVLQLTPAGEWNGPVRTMCGPSGPIVTCWVKFDHPTDDGSGDGPYGGAEVQLPYIEPVHGTTR